MYNSHYGKENKSEAILTYTYILHDFTVAELQRVYTIRSVPEKNCVPEEIYCDSRVSEIKFLQCRYFS